MTHIEITPNENQELALKFLVNWINNNHKEIELPEDTRITIDWANKLFMTLVGSAGTGKTTVLKWLLELIDNSKTRRIVVTAPTHKAKSVAERVTGLMGQTIQKLLGLRPNTDLEEFNIDNVLFDPIGTSEIANCDLVIVDECSMINEDLHKYITDQAARYKVKVLFVGDELQLPPVKEILSNTFKNTNCVRLTHIMRQSNTNPMNELLHRLREDIMNPHQNSFAEYLRDNPVAYNEDGEGYEMVRDESIMRDKMDVIFNSERFAEAKDLIKLCAWTNAAVGTANGTIRKMIYKDRAVQQLVLGEVLMSYKSISDGDGDVILANSEDYIVADLMPAQNFYDIPCLRVNLTRGVGGFKQPPIYIVDRNSYAEYKEKAGKFLKDAKLKKAWKAYFTFADNSLTMEPLKIRVMNNENVNPKSIDYGYALTVHKTQGSTYETIVVNARDIAKNRDVVERRKLMYVAISRASKNALIFV